MLKLNFRNFFIGLFAIVGVFAVITGYTSYEPKGSWELHIDETNSRVWSINTETGEVRRYENTYGREKNTDRLDYIIATQKEE